MTALAALALVVAWYLTAYHRGMLAAYLDHSRGHYEVQTYGFPAEWRHEYARLLRERYGVELNAVAGCVVSHDLVAYVDGYNAASRRLLTARFGSDIFADCRRQAMQEAGWTPE
jgi:hypothetical protein